MKREMIPCPHHVGMHNTNNTCNCASCIVKNPATGVFEAGICKVCNGTGFVPKLGTICQHHNDNFNMCHCASCLVKHPIDGSYKPGICKVCKGIGTV